MGHMIGDTPYKPLNLRETMKEGYPIGTITDGYHSFDELYEHRNLLFLNFLIHADYREEVTTYYTEDPNIPGWILVVMKSKKLGQISYHMEEGYSQFLKYITKIPWEQHEWDGHTSQEVIYRLANNIR